MKLKIPKGYFKINWPAVPIKAVYLVFQLGASRCATFASQQSLMLFSPPYIGMSMLYPYFTLQMEDLGLSVEDINFITGLLPFVTFFALPVSGFIGDKIGYRVILIVEMIGLAATSTYIPFIPTFYEATHVPTAALALGPDGAPATVASVQWPMQNCRDEEPTIEECRE